MFLKILERRRVIIVISGYPGAGKSALGKRLATRLGYKLYSFGSIINEEAQKRGVSSDEFYRELKNDPGLEKSMDEKFATLMETNDNIVVDARLGPFVKTPIPKISILLKVEPKIGARRLRKRDEYKNKSIKELIEIGRQRMSVERERYRSLYGIPNHLAERKFDIVLDTTKFSKAKMFRTVLQKIKKINPDL